MSPLAVWMYGQKVGVLDRSGERLSLDYTPEALQLGLGRPLLSVAMPTRTRAWQGAVTHAFFNGLLPEGEARRMIAYDFGVDDRDAFGLLEVLGRDCAGALVIIPEGEVPTSDGRPEPITDEQAAERIRSLRFAPLGVDQRLRVSLAGMQEKLLLARSDEAWALPVNGAPSTHILKPASQIMADSIANEAICMRTAWHLGLPVAPVEVLELDGVRVLAVERFDRRDPGGGGSVMRIHQEDLCQAHSLEPQRKYQGAGGPALRGCAQTLVRWGQGRADLERLLDLTALNVLIGNADAHAKNLSLLHDPDGRIELAPAYDLMSTTHYPHVSRVLGMFINGVEDIDAVTRDDLASEAAGWGLARASAQERVTDLVSRAPDAVAQACVEIGPPPGFAEGLARRADRLAR